MAIRKRSTLMRVGIDDYVKLKNYAKVLGEDVPRTLNKIITSPRLELDKRILEEAERRHMEAKRRLFR